MISSQYLERYCKDDFTKIKGFDDAMKHPEDEWVIHHRLELELPNGKERKHHLTRLELQMKNKLWHQPAKDLIILRKSEHQKLHVDYEKRHNSIHTSKSLDEARLFFIENLADEDLSEANLCKVLYEYGWKVSQMTVHRWRQKYHPFMNEEFYVGNPDACDWRYSFAFDLVDKKVLEVIKVVEDGIPGIEWEGYYFKVIKLPKTKDQWYELKALLLPGNACEENDNI